MGGDDAERIFPILFVFLFLASVAGFVLQHRFLSQLRSRHPDTWEALGCPTLFLNNTIGNGFAVQRFLWRRDYRGLSDDQFARFAAFVRAYQIGYAVLFLSAIGAFIFETRFARGA